VRPTLAVRNDEVPSFQSPYERSPPIECPRTTRTTRTKIKGPFARCAP
jgi:hypothetical protein